jgi:polysaccharide pyruvyl transferase WcaK-like protein
MSAGRSDPLPVPIFWGDPYSPNLGVQALGLAIASGIARRGYRPWLSSDRVKRPRTDSIGGVDFTAFPAVHSRKPWATGNIVRSMALARCGLGGLDRICRLMRGAAALDVSGGDSFATIYGPRRFRTMSSTKQLALTLGSPLVLMPQTYGPYTDDAQAEMSRLVRGARQAWARDRQSQAMIRGIREDAGLSADVAFTLPFDRPPADAPRDDGPIGFNLSGLVSRGTGGGTFGISLEVGAEFESMLAGLANASGGRPLLPVVHVHGAPGDHDSDAEAQRQIRERLIARGINVLPIFTPKSAIDAKSTIARCSFFVGIRMHACIAALSSTTPVVGLAYSLKTGPVFESVEVGDAVVDLRTAKPGEIATRTVEWYRRRDELRAPLVRSVPKAVASVETMFDTVVKSLPPAGR